MGASAARGGADPAYLAALKAVSDDCADAASRDGAAQARRASGAERAREGGAVESQELVSVGGASGVSLGGVGVGACLHGVPVVLEPLNRALGVVDF